MKRLLSFFLLIALLGFAAACDSSGPVEPTDDVVIPPETKVLDESSTSNLSSVSDDLRTLTFSGDDQEVASVEQGDVIVSGPDDKIPEGLLRKVSRVSRKGNTTTFTTTQATLDEAIQKGEVEIEGELTPADVERQEAHLEGISFGRPGESKLEQGVQGYFFIEVDDVVFFDNDGDAGTKEDQITADGSIEFAPDYEFSADIEDFELVQLRFITNMDTESELELEAGYELIREKKEVTIATYYFSPIVVAIPPSTFPVVLVPRLDMKVGIEGKVSVGVETSYTYQTETTAGLEYRGSDWSSISDFSKSAEYMFPRFSAETEAKLYAATPLSLLLYGVAGPFTSSRGYLEAEADLAEDPWWTLHWGIEVGAGVKMDALGRTVADYERPEVIGYESLLADAGGPYRSCKQIMEFNSVYFDLNSSELSDRARALLNWNGDPLVRCPNACVRVEGYASQDEEDAQELSEDRAEAVAEYYSEELGVSSSSIVVVGMGAEEGDAGGEQFRRVDSIPGECDL